MPLPFMRSQQNFFILLAPQLFPLLFIGSRRQLRKIASTQATSVKEFPCCLFAFSVVFPIALFEEAEGNGWEVKAYMFYICIKGVRGDLSFEKCPRDCGFIYKSPKLQTPGSHAGIWANPQSHDRSLAVLVVSPQTSSDTILFLVSWMQ